MKKQRKRIAFAIAGLLSFAAAAAGQVEIKGVIDKEAARPVIAVPDMRGTGNAQSVMDLFNKTLFSDLQDAGVFRMAPKTMYPLEVPQRPQDFRAPVNGQRQGIWLTDWSNPPVSANYLTLGYTAIQNGRLVLFGWLYNVQQPDVANAQVIGKLYFGDMNEDGARKVAHEFAADILARFGVTPVMGTKIYYTSTRSGNREIWVMDWDGANQKQLTRLGSITNFADVSPDHTRLAFTTYAKGTPSIMMMSLESGRILPFYNQSASLNGTPHFTPDGKLLFSSTAHVAPGKAGSANLYECNLDGSGIRRIAAAPAIEIEPKVNPKNPQVVVMTSGRSGPPQIYRMGRDGSDAVRLTTGEGDAVNPSWHPNGQHVAFAWTRGYDPGNFNIFVMDVATRELIQLTSGAGRNENPTWAPDGRHIVFSSNRSGSTQIWTMLADGTQLRQLTHQGRNSNPVWSR
jgi:TolB protein